MLFSSSLFLFGFLPILLGLYALARPRYRNLVLLTASILFYVWGEGAYVLVMIAIIAINYGLGRRVEMLAGRNRARITVAVAVALNLGLLIAFKYSNFLVDQLNVVLSVLHARPLKLCRCICRWGSRSSRFMHSRTSSIYIAANHTVASRSTLPFT